MQLATVSGGAYLVVEASLVRQTGGVVALGMDTWVSLGGLFVAVLTIVGFVRVGLTDLRNDLKGDVAGLRTELYGIRDELKGDIADFRTELKRDIADLRTELKGEITATRDELRGEVVSSRDDLKHDIGRLDNRMTVIEQRTYELRGLLAPVTRTESG